MRHMDQIGPSVRGGIVSMGAALVLLLVIAGRADANWVAGPQTYQVVSSSQTNYAAGAFGATAYGVSGQSTGSVSTSQSRDYTWEGGGQPVITNHGSNLSASVTGSNGSAAGESLSGGVSAYANLTTGPQTDSQTVTVTLGPGGGVTLTGGCNCDATGAGGSNTTGEAGIDL